MQVSIVAGSVQPAKDGQVIRVHPIRHDRSRELGAFANAWLASSGVAAANRRQCRGPMHGGYARSGALYAHEAGGDVSNADVDWCAMTARDGRRYPDGGLDAWQPAQPALDVLISPADEPRKTWLRQVLEASGALAWPGRHRMLMRGLAALLVVVAVGVGYFVTRPPPADPVVEVGVAVFDSGPSSSDFDSQGRVRAKLSYQVTARGTDDVITAVGVVGPGLTHPTSSISAVRFGLPKVGTLGATVDCSAPTWWAAKDTDYRARVRRTDTYGRVTTYDAPLGESNASWHNGVRGGCLRSFFESLPEATGSASAVLSKHVVKVTLRLTNAGRHDLWVLPATFADETVTGAGSFVVWTPLPAGGSATVTTSLHAADCSSGTPPRVPFAKNLEGVPGKDRALPVYLSDTKLPEDWQTAGAWARLDPAFTARLNRQLAALCPARTLRPSAVGAPSAGSER